LAFWKQFVLRRHSFGDLSVFLCDLSVLFGNLDSTVTREQLDLGTLAQSAQRHKLHHFTSNKQNLEVQL
jgi:hypothetical protein